jgi:ubiquinone/menaquinone biosynthesis C-methylase UbiE
MPPADQPPTARLPFVQRLLIAFLRSFFKLLYHQFAWAYDAVAAAVSLGTWQEWVKSVIPYLSQSTTLEIGFGTGHLQLALQKHNIPAFGLDESSHMARITSRRLIKSGMHANLLRADAAHLPFAARSFTQLVMTFPADFTFRPSTLLEIHRLLSPGGLVIILPFAWITGHRPWERFIAWVYHVTGQAPAWDERILAPLQFAGFELTWEKVTFPSSQVLIVRLRKPILVV